MQKSVSQKREWTLTEEAFDRLLGLLDPQRDRAGEVLENLRRKLMKFFESRGCLSPDECSDDTIDRVARALDQGVEIRTLTPALYFHGVARHVLREYWRKPERKESALESLTPQNPSESPGMLEAQELAQENSRRRYDCLKSCMNKLPDNERETITQYYQATGRTKIENRNRLAQELSLTINALRIRAYRLREVLQGCMENYLKRSRKA